jgi:hypothetical protein
VSIEVPNSAPAAGSGSILTCMPFCNILEFLLQLRWRNKSWRKLECGADIEKAASLVFAFILRHQFRAGLVA